MSFLDTILNGFFESKGFDEFIEPIQVEGESFRGRQANKGNVFVQKQDPNTGKNVLLERPQGSPTTFGEMVGQLPTAQEQSPSFGDFLPGSFNILKSLGQITGMNGSPLWDKGLDIDLKNGDPVQTPVSGVVDFVGPRGGFGNQVRVKGTDGREYWLSHLLSSNVTPGQKVNAGQVVGAGGNTGNVIPGPGGDGSHLDLTVKDQQGKYLQAKEVYNLLNTYG